MAEDRASVGENGTPNLETKPHVEVVFQLSNWRGRGEISRHSFPPSGWEGELAQRRLQFDLRDPPPLFRSLPSMPVVAQTFLRDRHDTSDRRRFHSQAAMTSTNQTNPTDPTSMNGSAHKIKWKKEWIAVPTQLPFLPSSLSAHLQFAMQ